MQAVSSELSAHRALLSSRFSSKFPSVLIGRAQLFTDRIEFMGLGWRGLWRKEVPLSDVAQVEWFAGGGERIANLVLHLHSRRALHLWVKGAGLWKCEIQGRARHLVEDTMKLPDAMASAA